ncbi:MAG: type B 50S ribosomal protein L31 [Bdellovibrionales bacterium]|nr:type B 50S ribosomal protein L31 [Bdellovibrionales bacterium]
MKKKIHPEFREVVFKDVSTQFHIITKSTVKTKNTTELNGKSYPVVTFDVSSASHPFYTGQQRLLDTEGRAEKFRKKYAKVSKIEAK